MSANLTSPDIYQISYTVNQIQRKFFPTVSEDTLSMSIFGANNDIFSNQIQNAIINASEWGNEAFPIRAKFDKSILTYAVQYDIQDINAIPASMDVMICFVEKELVANMNKGVFVLDKDCPIAIGGYEFHLDYDMIITKSDLDNGESVYAARYAIDRINAISTIENPYLQPPVFFTLYNDKFVCMTCTLRQVQKEIMYKKIITSNIFENKTLDFEFTNQLASFELLVKEGTNETWLTPIFEGMPINGNTKYCFYNYIDSNTIRIKFDRDSYEPRVNCDVEIHTQLTLGSGGNFMYNKDVTQTLVSKTYGYANLSMLIKVGDEGSVYGIDRKSTKELKQIIPKQILSRGNITNNKDLENFFNKLNFSKLYFYKRRDNQQERLYYAYMIVKDASNNIIPTNTINLSINESEFCGHTDGRYLIPSGTMFKLGDKYSTVFTPKDDDGYDLTASAILDLEKKEFLYSTPITMVMNKSPLSVSYYMPNVNSTTPFKFLFINQNSELQFISTSMSCRKIYLEDPNRYTLSMNIVQNINIDKELVTVDKFENITSSLVKPVLVIETSKNKYYKFGNIVEYHKDTFSYKVDFTLDTDNIINKDNKIKVTDLYLAGSSIPTYAYLDEQVKMTVFLYLKTDLNLGRSDADLIVPNMEGYSLTNKYECQSKVNMFYNYTNVIKSVVNVSKNEFGQNQYNIKSVPVVRYSYINNIKRYEKFMEFIQYRKAYIDMALKVLEDSFTIDMKFFNTYGPSKMFKIGHDGTPLDKVNINVTFKIKLQVGAAKDTTSLISAEIKNYIENINTDLIDNIHMTNLSTDLTNKFKDYVKYVEFIGINNYNALYQNIDKIDLENIEDVPEFLNINLSNNINPDINIIPV